MSTYMVQTQVHAESCEQLWTDIANLCRSNRSMSFTSRNIYVRTNTCQFYADHIDMPPDRNLSFPNRNRHLGQKLRTDTYTPEQKHVISKQNRIPPNRTLSFTDRDIYFRATTPDRNMYFQPETCHFRTETDTSEHKLRAETYCYNQEHELVCDMNSHCVWVDRTLEAETITAGLQHGPCFFAFYL